jgi:hypothetical protein
MMTNNTLTKTFTSGGIVFGVLAGMTIGVMPAQSAIVVVPTPVDELTRLNITWEWDQVLSGTRPDADIPGSERKFDKNDPNLSNWDFLISLQDKPDGTIGFSISGNHTAIPHPIPDGGTGDFVLFGGLVPGFGGSDGQAQATVSHGEHFDDYSLRIFTLSNGNVRFNLQGVHTPELTSTLSLLALGSFGAASTLKRKLKPSQSIEKETTKVG